MKFYVIFNDIKPEIVETFDSRQAAEEFAEVLNGASYEIFYVRSEEEVMENGNLF